MSPLAQLKSHGQSFWLDSLSRHTLEDGTLERLIRDHGLSGITSNPAIFSKTIGQSPQYDRLTREALASASDVESVYETLAINDVRDACDILRPVYDRTEGADGFVSLEVSPHIAYDPIATTQEALRLKEAVARPNLFIKVPATRSGLHAIETLLYEGVNINITLLFSISAYSQTVQAYLRALERRLEDGRPLSTLSSVASFFLSRIDVAVDLELRQRLHPKVDERIRHKAEALLGQAAIANARLAYKTFNEIMQSERWHRLAREGARPQRLVWASTGTKDPDYSDVMYIEPLIGPNTVSTMPKATADAFADHGRVAPTLTHHMLESTSAMDGLEQLGIDFDAVTTHLLGAGIQKFIDPYDELLAGLDQRCRAIRRAQQAQPLADTAARLRASVVRMTTAAGSGHATSSLSCADLIAALFFHEMRWDPQAPGRRDMDRFLLSKGHAAPILWAALHEAGALDTDPLTLRRLDSDLEGHPTPENPWVPVATGSLGQGLSVVNGMALADRMDGIEARHFCLLGDAECSEGSVWEAAQFAADNALDQVVVLVDANGLGQSGPSPYGQDTDVLAARFRSFGWEAIEIDGHQFGEILPALERARGPKPTALIARTIKGKGVSFLENIVSWHGKALDAGERDRALAEIAAPDLQVRVEPRRVRVAGSVATASLTMASPPHRHDTDRDATPHHSEQSAPVTLEFDYTPGEEVATRSAFGNALEKLGSRLDDLIVLDGDVKNSTKTEVFARAFPQRFIEAQIAEQNMIGVALGLAVSNKRPCAATFSAFLTRAYDILRMAAHSRPPHLLVCGSHAGVSIGEDGASQMGLEDIAMFRALEGTTILCPCDAVSAERLTEIAVAHPGIVYLRTTRGKTPVIYDSKQTFPVGGSKTLRTSDEDRLTLVATGITVFTALEAHALLLQRGITTRVVDAYSIKPLDVETLQRAARETEGVLVIEDHNRHGGLGDAVAAQIGRLGRVFHLGVSGEPHSATADELLERHRLSPTEIEREALAIAA